MDSRRPDFARPPVVETVISLQFAPIEGFTAFHFGLFWERIREAYPKAEGKNPLAPLPQFAAVPPFIQFRAWYTDASEEHLVQLQNDRLTLNWRKAGDADYPHYEQMRPRFERLWGMLVAFLADERLPEPRATLCEVTYVNDISLEDVVAISPRLNEVFPILPADPPALARGAAFLDFSETLLLQPEQIQVRIALAHAFKIAESRQVLQMQISTVRALESADIARVFAQLDTNQELAVRVFVESTSAKLHNLWGRKDVS